MAETFNNVPMTKEQAERVAKTDGAWTGPKLIGLAFATLAVAFTVLWLAANGSFSTYREYQNVGHDLEAPR